MTNELIQNGWFKEKDVLWPGQALQLKVEKVHTHFKSKYQDILVFDSLSYGRVLVLDGVIQLTEKDESGYQEMIAQVPLFAQGNPENVLIIGGGDGGVLREVSKHSKVKKITMCEIDVDVIETSKKYFAKSMATSFNDPRLELVTKDGALFLAECKMKYDVIIVDSSDPVGPAASLYTKNFYEKMKNVMTTNGVLCMQGENIFLHLDLIKELLSFCKNLFPNVSYFNTLVPTYPSGCIGFVLCSNNDANDLSKVSKNMIEDYEKIKNHFKYYTKEVHSASFVLPKFVSEAISQFIKK